MNRSEICIRFNITCSRTGSRALRLFKTVNRLTAWKILVQVVRTYINVFMQPSEDLLCCCFVSTAYIT
jgi:hypothetical protein